jgi:hypothetical protein
MISIIAGVLLLALWFGFFMVAAHIISDLGL